MFRHRPLNTAMADQLGSVDIGKDQSMQDKDIVHAEVIGQEIFERASQVTEIQVKPELLKTGRTKVINLTKNFKPPRDRFFIDELKYHYCEELKCGFLMHIEVGEGDDKKEIRVIVAKPENSRMFHILSAADSSYRLGYAFLGHPEKNPRENKFHDVDWSNLRGPVHFIVAPKTPNKNSVIVNKLGIPHGTLAIQVSRAIESWFRSEFERYVEPMKMRSINALQRMIFENIDIDFAESGIRWQKNRGSKELRAFRATQFGKSEKSDLHPDNSFGHAFIDQDKKGQWKPTVDSNGNNLRAPTKHGGKGGMLSLVRNLIHRIIDSHKEVSPDML